MSLSNRVAKDISLVEDDWPVDPADINAVRCLNLARDLPDIEEVVQRVLVRDGAGLDMDYS